MAKVYKSRSAYVISKSETRLKEKTEFPHPCLSCGSMFIGEGLLCKSCRKQKHGSLYLIEKKPRLIGLREFTISVGICWFALLVIIGVTCL